ncbi:MAG: hypothetical protein WC352_01055 [Candidatus Omnitrophota bacterium]|jgi:hypothetical protein
MIVRFPKKLAAVAVLVAFGLFPGCFRKGKSPAELEEGLRAPVKKIIQAAQVDLYPESELLKDSVSTREYLQPGNETVRAVRYLSTATVTMVAQDPLQKIRSFYEGKYPFVVSKQSAGAEVTSIQLSSVKDIPTALAAEITPIVLVSIQKPKLSPTEMTAYRSEISLLKRRSANDAMARKRVDQLENLLKEYPLIKISVREISDVRSAA